MKTTSIIYLGVSLLLVLTLAGCDNVFGTGDDDYAGDVVDGSLVDLAVAAELEELLAVVTYIDSNSKEETPSLAGILSNEDAELTVFAPSDAAFEALYADAGAADRGAFVSAVESALGDSEAAAEALFKVVANHVTDVGAVRSTELTDGQFIPTLADPDAEAGDNFGLDIDLSSGVDVIPSEASYTATVDSADNRAINGFAHVIDTVLIDSTTATALGL